jgi:branched-chain amino acid transport system substrate-binding protein
MSISRSLLLPAALAAIAIILGACSLMLSLEECQSDSDCEELGQGLVCSSEGLCQDDDDNGVECQDHSDCDDAGEDWQCDDGQCVPPEGPQTCEEDEDCDDGMSCNELGTCQEPSDLLGGPCTLASGDINHSNAFVVGILLPLTGEEAGFGQPLFNAINVAMSDFNNVGGVRGRPIALVACDTEGQDDLALAGAQHLADVGIEAVIGPDYSNQTIDVATQVTVAAEMALVSPSATAAAITFLEDNGLVWRTVASDTVQGSALGQLVDHLLEDRPLFDADDPQFPAHPSLAVLLRGDDPYADGLRDALFDELPVEFSEGGAQTTVRSYQDDYAGTAADVIAQTVDENGYGPDVIVIIGSAEAWLLAEFLDGDFNNPPIFVFADAARNSERAAEAPASLRGRVWGTAPQNVGAINYPPYTRFRLRYQEVYGENPDDFQFAANAFDALYVLSLGAAYGGFDGPGIAEGMAQLSDQEAQQFDPRPTDAQQAMSILAGGDTVNFRGASGPLNFDENGDPQSSPTVLWCFDDAGLPEQGVLVDEDLQFHPQSCSPGTTDNSCDGETLEICGGECVDTDTDVDHCGECNESCNPDEHCIDGTCTPS